MMSGARKSVAAAVIQVTVTQKETENKETRKETSKDTSWSFLLKK